MEANDPACGSCQHVLTMHGPSQSTRPGIDGRVQASQIGWRCAAPGCDCGRWQPNAAAKAKYRENVWRKGKRGG